MKFTKPYLVLFNGYPVEIDGHDGRFDDVSLAREYLNRFIDQRWGYKQLYVYYPSGCRLNAGLPDETPLDTVFQLREYNAIESGYIIIRDVSKVQDYKRICEKIDAVKTALDQLGEIGISSSKVPELKLLFESTVLDCPWAASSWSC